LDIRIRLQTHYPAGYPTGKPVSDHLWYTGLILLWSITSSSLMLLVHRFVKADIRPIRIAKGLLSHARLVRRYSSKVRLQNAFIFF